MKSGRRILHLMPDEKFIDHFIEQSEVAMHSKCDYWIVVNSVSDELKYTKSTLIEKIEWNASSISNLAIKANKYEKIVLHGFHRPLMLEFLRKLDKHLNVLWMFWGVDGYGYTSERSKWFLPLTLQWKDEMIGKNARTLNKVYRRIFHFLNARRKVNITRRIIKRIDICVTWVKYDYEMIKFINPRMSWRYYSYFTFEQLQLANIPVISPDTERIWLGNSATETNNHLDALHFLKEINWPGEILVPLSYGNDAYARAIVEFGEMSFGKRFIPITSFMPLHEYHELMNSCGIIWMNHLRQQASGNTLGALSLGKAVIMNEQSNLFKTLKDWGVVFMNRDELKHKRIPSQTALEKNIEIVQKNLALEKCIEDLKKLYMS